MFDVGRLLREQFGDYDKTWKMLGAYGYEVERMTVYQWFRREAVPAMWILTLLSLREIETGTYVILARYLK